METGEFEEFTNSDFEPDEDSVYIFISVYNKTCYLWYGKNSGVRKQFIAANEGRKIKLDTGFNSCNVTHEGAEEEFEKVLNEWRNDSTRSTNPAKVIQEQRERMADMIVKSSGGSAVPASKPTSAPPAKTSPMKSSPAKPSPAPSTSSSVGQRVVKLKPVPAKAKSESNFNITTEDSPVEEEPKRIVKQTLAPPVKTSNSPAPSGNSSNYSKVLDMLERMKSFGEVENHSRKYIVTDDQVFSISESNGKYDVQKFDEVVSGIFEVKNFHPRFLMENSKIVAIELWKKD